MKSAMKDCINRSIGWIANGIVILFLLLSTNTFADTYRVGDTFRDCATCPEMVVVPSGSFMRGSLASELALRQFLPDLLPGGADSSFASKNGGSSTERQQHQVTISKPFAVGKYEVTVGQFEEFANETKHPSNKWRDPGFDQSANYPVVNVSWEYAKAYTKWLSKKTGQNYRLLSEAEWEYAARAGTTTTYHFGETISPSQANYYASSIGGTVEVGSYPANAFGLHDVHGNVWEWVEDCWHDDYIGAPSDGRAWTSDCSYLDDEDKRVLRGGSWNGLTGVLRSAYRVGAQRSGTWYRNGSGFRIARTLTP